MIKILRVNHVGNKLYIWRGKHFCFKVFYTTKTKVINNGIFLSSVVNLRKLEMEFTPYWKVLKKKILNNRQSENFHIHKVSILY